MADREQQPPIDGHEGCRRQIYDLQRKLAERTGTVAKVLQHTPEDLVTYYKALEVERVVITTEGLVVYVR
jgi:hypothetical protein